MRMYLLFMAIYLMYIPHFIQVLSKENMFDRIRITETKGQPAFTRSLVSVVALIVYRGYSNFLLNMAFISSSEVENIYIS